LTGGDDGVETDCGAELAGVEVRFLCAMAGMLVFGFSLRFLTVAEDVVDDDDDDGVRTVSVAFVRSFCSWPDVVFLGCFLIFFLAEADGCAGMVGGFEGAVNAFPDVCSRSLPRKLGVVSVVFILVCLFFFFLTDDEGVEAAAAAVVVRTGVGVGC